MSAPIRGPASGRFYTAFHAWSRLGRVSHQQRRCFVPTASLYEANDDEPRPSEATPANLQKHALLVKIPQARLERMQQHPTYLQKMHAGVNATIQPRGPPSADGFRVVRVEAPTSGTCRYVKQILLRRADDLQTLDNTFFKMDRNVLKNRTLEFVIDVSSERASLLEDNANELERRIEDTFSVQLNFVPELQGATNDGMRSIAITGRRPNVDAAKDFIHSLVYDLEEPIDIKEQQADEPLEPSLVGLKPKKKPLTIQDTYKYTMRSVPSSVVVLTTRASSSASDIDSFRGMTVSSLTSVTLEPEPIISFSIRGPSRTLDGIIAGQPFAVNFLSDHPVGARIADVFSKPHNHPSQPFHAVQSLRLARIYAQDNDSAPPHLGGKQIPARFTCELLPGKSLEIGDHTVIFARVTEVWRSQRFMDSQSGRPTFLAYAQAGYRTLTPEPIHLRNLKALESFQSKESAPSPSEAPALQTPQTEAESQNIQVFDEADSEELTKSDAANNLSDAYWRMALDEDEGDSPLEERAADQRASGEAQESADHPVAGVEDDLLDQASPKKQDN